MKVLLLCIVTVSALSSTRPKLNSNWLVLSSNKPEFIATSLLVLHANISITEGYATKTIAVTVFGNRIESDFCGLAELVYIDKNITMNKTISLRRHDETAVFIEMMEKIVEAAITDDRYNVRYILPPIKYFNEHHYHTFIYPLNYTIGNVARYGCLEFYTADGKQHNKCRDPMMPGVIVGDSIYPTFPKLSRWKCATAAIENRAVIEQTNVTLYSRLNNKTMIVIPGDDIVVVNTLPPEAFNKMSHTVKNSSALFICVKMKICLIRNLTIEKHVYTINSETLEVEHLTHMPEEEMPLLDYEIYTNGSIAEDPIEVLFIPIDSNYSTVIILLSILAAILGFVITFLTVITLRLIRNGKKERVQARKIYRDLQQELTASQV